MSLPNSILRRYPCPTCTLEITGRNSALSQWTGQPVVKRLRFLLRFESGDELADELTDDATDGSPRLLEIRGDRAQLERLSAVVGTYVQQLLDRSPEQLSATLLQPNARDRASEETPEANAPAEPSAMAASDEAKIEATIFPFDPSIPTLGTAAEISLQSVGWLSHRLQLGALANEATGAALQLSTLQLFDLATVLDQSELELMALPSVSRLRWLKQPPTWIRTAAVVLLTVGVTATTLKLVEWRQPASENTALAPASEQDVSQSALDGGLEEALPTDPSLLPSLSSDAKLPSPPVPGATTAPGGLPTVSVPSLPSARGPYDASPNRTTANAPSRSSSIPVPPAPQPAPASGRLDAKRQEARSQEEFGDAAAEFAKPSSSGASRSAAPPASAPATTNNQLFDTIPQVAEARTYFQQRWQPMPSLRQTLEYRLVLNANGSLKQIVPLGQAAATFLDRTGMPLVGEPFVSALPSGMNRATVRLVLSPEGKVTVFME